MCLPRVLLRTQVDLQGCGLACGSGGFFGSGCHYDDGWLLWWSSTLWDDDRTRACGVSTEADCLQQPRENGLTAGWGQRQLGRLLRPRHPLLKRYPQDFQSINFGTNARDGNGKEKWSSSQEQLDLDQSKRTEDALKRLQQHANKIAARQFHRPLQHPLQDMIWLFAELSSLPNALSLSRVLFGPVIAYWVVLDMWAAAVGGLVVAGATDWLDGYIAKQQGKQSILGSYLDPLGDKVLIGCVVGVLVYKGSLPLWVAGTIIARDIFLVAGTLAHHSGRTTMAGLTWRELLEVLKGNSSKKDSVLVQPLFVSKVNTVIQLCLVAGCMSQGLLGWPGDKEILWMSWAAVTTTLVSWGAYVQGYYGGKGRLP